MSLEISLQRIIAQRLAGPALTDAHAVVSHLSAVQAQDLRSATDAIALRSAGAPLATALEKGVVVRSWPMRGTLHLVTSATLPRMLALTGARQFHQATRRRESLGIDEAIIDTATTLALTRIHEGGPASRADLQEVWRPLHASENQGWTYHLIYSLAILGHIAQGPPHPSRPGEQLFVAFEDLPHVADPRSALASAPAGEPEELLAHWASDYARSHGPVTAADFARWTGLPLGRARAALTAAEALPDPFAVEKSDADGSPMWRDPAMPDLLAEHRAAARAELFLPAFDELVIGYADRTATLDARHEAYVVPGKNGVFRPVQVRGGRAVGTWTRTGGPASAIPFPPP